MVLEKKQFIEFKLGDSETQDEDDRVVRDDKEQIMEAIGSRKHILVLTLFRSTGFVILN